MEPVKPGVDHLVEVVLYPRPGVTGTDDLAAHGDCLHGDPCPHGDLWPQLLVEGIGVPWDEALACGVEATEWLDC